MLFGAAPPGYRLPDGTHVGAAHIQVADLARSINHYERVIGLRVGARLEHGVAMAPQGDGRPLLWIHEKPGVVPAPRRGAYGLFHFAILLPDRRALGRFASHLLKLGVRVGMADHIVSESFYLTDPDGLGIEVYADRPRDTWRAGPGGELVMGTESLDVADVIAAASGAQWDGAPAGTTLGHMHLHVGDLGEAEAFYHRALGFDKTVWNYPGALFLAAGGYHHHLGTNIWSPGPSATDDQARLLEWELRLPDAGAVDGAERSVAAAGYPTARDADACVTADPWGTRLRIRPA